MRRAGGAEEQPQLLRMMWLLLSEQSTDHRGELVHCGPCRHVVRHAESRPRSRGQPREPAKIARDVGGESQCLARSHTNGPQLRNHAWGTEIYLHILCAHACLARSHTNGLTISVPKS
eukprot:COSAG05_NODE_8243_length_723_cov_1.145833_1_plen_117_part_10